MISQSTTIRERTTLEAASRDRDSGHKGSVPKFSDVGETDAFRRAARLLAEARRPALLIGRGALDAQAELAALVDLLALPHVCTPSAKGVLDERSPLHHGVALAGGHRARRLLSAGVDVLLVVGSSLGEFSSFNFSKAIQPETALIQIDRDARVFARTYHHTLPVRGDAARAVRALLWELHALERKPPYDWASELEPDDKPDVYSDNAVEGLLFPEQALMELAKYLPPKTRTLVDIGTATFAGSHHYPLEPGQRFNLPLGWASVGQAVASAVGTRLGSGACTVVIAGDLALLNSLTALKDAAEHHFKYHDLNQLVFFVLNNSGSGLVTAGVQQATGSSTHGIVTGDYARRVPLCPIAEALSVPGFLIQQLSDIGPAMRAALAANGPALLDAHVAIGKPPLDDRNENVVTGSSPTSLAEGDTHD